MSDYEISADGKLIVFCPCCERELYGNHRRGRLIIIRNNAAADAVTLREALKKAPQKTEKDRAAREKILRNLQAAEQRVSELARD